MQVRNAATPAVSQDKALLAMTIGQAFDNTVAQLRRTGGAGGAPSTAALHLAATGRRRRTCTPRALLALGLQTGDRLGIWAPNCAQWCITQIATAKIGVILVNINPAYRSSELEYVLKQSGCQWLVCAGAFKTSNYHAMLQGLVPELAEQSIGKLSSERLPELRGVDQPGCAAAQRFPAVVATG